MNNNTPRKTLNHYSFLEFVKHIQNQESEFEIAFEESRIWNIELIVPLICSFELSDKIRKGRITNVSLDQIVETIKHLEMSYSCEIEGLSREFVNFVVRTHFEEFELKFGNLSNSIPELTNSFYDSEFME